MNTNELNEISIRADKGKRLLDSIFAVELMLEQVDKPKRIDIHVNNYELAERIKMYDGVGSNKLYLAEKLAPAVKQILKQLLKELNQEFYDL